MQTTRPSITLYTLGGAFGMRNVSPFCLKLEMLLKSLGLPFEMAVQPNPGKAPKGKLPFLVADGKTLADSELIVEYLDELSGGKVYEGLTATDKAIGVAMTRLAEDHLYWIIVASRWLDDDWWPNIVRDFFHIAPAPIRPLVSRLARREVRQTYHLQGLGRHSLEEQRGFARRDLQALQDAISIDGFLFGDTPNVYDFTVASILAGLYDNKPETWLTTLAREYDQLHAYAERVQEYIGVYGRPG